MATVAGLRRYAGFLHSLFELLPSNTTAERQIRNTIFVRAQHFSQ